MKQDKINFYKFNNLIRWVMTIISIILCFYITYTVNDNKILIAVFVVNLLITLTVYKIFNVAKPIKKEDIKTKYVYHCLSKQKLEKVMSGGVVNLKKTTDKLHNLSTLCEPSPTYRSRGFLFSLTYQILTTKVDFIIYSLKTIFVMVSNDKQHIGIIL